MSAEIRTQIARILATQIRVMTLQQIANHYCLRHTNSRAATRRLVKRLVRDGLVSTWATTAVHLPVAQPLLHWIPGQHHPHFGRLAWSNQCRWQAAIPAAAVCVVATDKARALFAGTIRPPRPRELEHDIAVTELYLQLRKQGLSDNHWQHEDSFPDQSEKRPDAILTREEEPVFLDVLGRGYGHKRIKQLWRTFRHQQLQLY